MDRLAARQGQGAVLGQQAALLVAAGVGAVEVAAPVEVIGVYLQGVEQAEKHLLLGGADAGLVVAHGGHRHAQPLGQLAPAQAQLLAPAAHLLTKGHKHTSYVCDRFRHVFLYSNPKVWLCQCSLTRNL